MAYTLFAENETSAEPASSFDAGTDNSATFKSVLVGVDGTSTGRDAIALAEKLCDADGRLTLAHVVLVPRPVYGNFSSTGAGKKARDMLEREREAAGVSAELTGIFAPSVGSGLHQLAADTGADLLVVGSCSRRPIARLLRGDDTRATLSAAACPGGRGLAPLCRAAEADRHDRRGIRRQPRIRAGADSGSRAGRASRRSTPRRDCGVADDGHAAPRATAAACRRLVGDDA